MKRLKFPKLGTGPVKSSPKRPSKKQLRREVAAVLERIKDRQVLEFVFGCTFGCVASALPDRPDLIPEHFRPMLARIQEAHDAGMPEAVEFRDAGIELAKQLSLKLDVN